MKNIIEIFKSKNIYKKIKFIDKNNNKFHMIRDTYNGLKNYIIELICKYWNDTNNRNENII